MAFTNPVNSLTIPSGATTGQARIVEGSDIPPELSTFYGATIKACILFYSDQGTPTAQQYNYQALVVGPGTASLAVGYWDSVTVREFTRVAGNNLTFRSNDIFWQDTNGSTTLGQWTTMTLNAPFTPRGGAYRAPSVRRIASPPNSIQVDGQYNYGSAANGSVLAVLPVGYRPKTYTVQFPIEGQPANGQTPLAELDTAGNLKVWGIAAAAVTGAIMGTAPLD